MQRLLYPPKYLKRVIAEQIIFDEEEKEEKEVKEKKEEKEEKNLAKLIDNDLEEAKF